MSIPLTNRRQVPNLDGSTGRHYGNLVFSVKSNKECPFMQIISGAKNHCMKDKKPCPGLGNYGCAFRDAVTKWGKKGWYGKTFKNGRDYGKVETPDYGKK